MSSIFYNCQKLKNLPDISRWDTSKVKTLSAMFYGCSSLEKLPDISCWNITNATNICFMNVNHYINFQIYLNGI